MLLAMLVLYSCSEDDSTNLDPQPPAASTEVIEYIEYFESEPFARQRSLFTYDNNNNIVRYEFSTNLEGTLPDGEWFTTIFSTYEYNGGLLRSSIQSIFDFGNEVFVPVQENQYVYDANNTLSEIIRFGLDERTGEIFEVTRTFTFNENNSISRIAIDGTPVAQYVYDSNGELTQIIGDETDLGPLITGFSFTNIRNPFFRIPPLFGNRFIIGTGLLFENEFLPERSSNHINSLDNPPASSIRYEYELDDNQRPIRRIATVTNSDPIVEFSIITEIRYRN